MEFGLSFLPDADPTTLSATEYFAAALDLACLADTAGLRAVKMTEHYLHPYGGYCPSPLLFLTAVAARTRRIRLMTGALLPAFHHPIQLAAETALVDVLSGGRLEVGFARAFSPHEFEAFGVPLDESRTRFEATVDAVLRLWQQPAVTLSTPFFSFRDARCLPQPVQRPRPPVWGVAVRSRQSFAWLGERGFNLLLALTVQTLGQLREQVAIYREAWSASEHPGRGRIGLLVPLFLAPTQREAEELGDRFYERHQAVWLHAASAWDRVRSDAYPGYEGIADVIRHAAPRRLREANNLYFGEPSRVAELLARLEQDLGPDDVLWNLDFGAMPASLSRRTLELFLGPVLDRCALKSLSQQ